MMNRIKEVNQINRFPQRTLFDRKSSKITSNINDTGLNKTFVRNLQNLLHRPKHGYVSFMAILFKNFKH